LLTVNYRVTRGQAWSS